MKIYAIIAFAQRFGYKRTNLPGLTLGGEPPKFLFDCAGKQGA
jgi:hypothetical protein